MANTYLTWTPSSSGTRAKWTFSAWVKKGETTGNGTLFFAGGSNSDYSKILLQSSGELFISEVGGGSTVWEVQTNRLFRDPLAFYHIVIAYDSAQSTASNRVKIYINGVQETSFSATSYPAQNRGAMWLASGTEHRIGRDYISQYFGGVMSHIHFSDGYALAPTVFGSTDSVTGEWSIETSPSFTLGTYGFTILKDGSTITDQSSNSNDWSLGGGTLTKTLDCADNVMATLNPLSGSLTNNTLSQGNNTVQTTSGWRWRPSTIAPSSGKYYAEFKPTSSAPIYTAIGVTPQVSWRLIDEETIGSGAGGENKSVGYTHSGTVRKGNSTIYTGSSYTTNDIIGVAMDLDNYYVYFSKNGVWQNSGDPTSGATGTGAVSLATTLDDWSISTSQAGTTIACNYGNGYFGTTAITTNSGNGYAGAEGASKFSYQPPTGYSALNTKGLNQ